MAKIKDILEQVASGALSADDALQTLSGMDDLGFAKVDTHRHHRRGLPEVIFCPGKTSEQIIEIMGALKAEFGEFQEPIRF